MMNKETLKLFAYTGSIVIFILFSVLAIFSPKDRLIWLMAAFTFLGVGWLVELLFSQKRNLASHGRAWHELGFISVDKELAISDQLSLSEAQVLEGLPAGLYSVRVETFSDRGSCYVAAVVLTGPVVWRSPRHQEVRLTVDTGFLIFASSETSEEVLQRVKEAQSKILSERDRRVDAEMVTVGHRNVGIVTSTGFGDGQYRVTLGADTNDKPVIVCSFINGGNGSKLGS